MDWKNAFADIEGEPVLEGGPRALAAAQESGLLLVRLEGRRVPDKRALMAALAREMRFPAYFGANWDALRDCLTDLDEFLPAPGWLLVVADSAELLKGEPGERAAFLETLASAALFWRQADPPHAFKVLLA